ncbi:MAG: type II toxin-antitoxin system PemK/MazF family toxin [Candidatus Aenigmarchaeota archaeon]|nr:type II toxin-antitoxin system PemK/MazF family toxin [Candidatus Aenigmarchaeota archaeon]
MNQQDLVWVRLPFSNFRESKVRPAVVVSNSEYNKGSSDIIVCAITSKLEGKQYSILIDNKNLSKGDLPIKSRVRADKILQMEKGLVIKSFARLDDKTFDLLVEEILKLVQRS